METHTSKLDRREDPPPPPPFKVSADTRRAEFQAALTAKHPSGDPRSAETDLGSGSGCFDEADLVAEGKKPPAPTGKEPPLKPPFRNVTAASDVRGPGRLSQ